ncbi:MAG: response regulator transcription factor [Taibaiella sp.]|nr:response regulator transcription factor [Taibaiella sp.]
MNTKLTAIIIDDEKDGRDTLKHYLQKYCPEVSVLAEAASVSAAAALIKAHNPWLIFLDINLSGESGFELLDHTGVQETYKTIFVTAHDEYAIQAIRKHAFDYILKPIHIETLVNAVNRAKESAATPPSGAIKELFQVIQSRQQEQRLALPVLDGFIYVDIREIVRCEAEGNYTLFYFHTRNKILICKTLGYYETILKDQGFVRIHHHHLINLKYVERYQRGRGGIVYMSDQSELPVSQRKRDDFLYMLQQFS